MILPLQQAVRAALQDTLTTLYGASAVPATIVLETPPSRALGDLATPCAFELARLLRKAAPRLRVLAHSEIPEVHSIRIGRIIGDSK